MPESDVRRVASMIHAALTLGVIAFAAVAAVLVQANAMPAVAGGGVPLLRIVALVVAAGGLMAVNVLRQRVSPPAARAEPGDWQAAMGRAIVVWALAEGIALIGIVFWLITRDAVMLLPLLVGLALLVWHRPSTLLEP